ncbi:MAG: hypothetical protein GY788_29065 [bacterium]|nr:hypothetical protein [bacterium]
MKYWDIVDQFFWSPKYLGLRSIPKRHWEVGDGRISVPSDLVNSSGPLYSRRRRIADLKEDLHGME